MKNVKDMEASEVNGQQTAAETKQAINPMPGERKNDYTFLTCGHFTNENGVGNTSVGMHSSHRARWPWIDLLEIKFATNDEKLEAQLHRQHTYFWSGKAAKDDLTQEQRNKVDKDMKDYGNMHRRLSRVQADLVGRVIAAALNKHFANGIPSDEEIKAGLKNKTNQG